MMLKLALTSVKKRWQDYLVLLMGLVISVAIFYMFQTLSLNTSFLEQNISISMVAIIFQLGAFLLGIITVVYIFYANSFLLSMRKKEYGMYLLLGAKKRKISQMIGLETVLIGGAATLIGLGLGTVLAQVMGTWLSQAIDLPAQTYEPFVLPALVVTLIFFSVLFLLTTSLNIFMFRKTRTLELLYGEAQSERPSQSKVRVLLKTLLAVILIAIGYYCMVEIKQQQLLGVFVAIVTITPGTFLFFSSLVPVLVKGLKNSPRMSQRGIKIFTFSQLSFKATNLARVLGLVTMLLALSLGAMTVAQSFNNLSNDLLNIYPNDVLVYDATPALQEKLAAVKEAQAITYHKKTAEDIHYFLASEVTAQPLYYSEFKETLPELKELQGLVVNQLYTQAENNQIGLAFKNLQNPYRQDQTPEDNFMLLTDEDFAARKGHEEVIQILRVPDYKAQAPLFKEIDLLEQERNGGPGIGTAKYQDYIKVISLTSGFMFMGFFLGLAFLAMLASCLMFKILSGAYQDETRYQMLHKIGVSRKLLKKSLRQELFFVFLAPALLGVVHVLVGLKMFAIFLPDPYAYILLPFALYTTIYFGYYLVTVVLYQGIVLPPKK